MTSLPVPDVVGTATIGATFIMTFIRPAIFPIGVLGLATRAAAALAASMGEPPPIARKPSQPFSRYCARIASTVFTEGFAST